ncbi:MAG: extracellular matrix/biofilm biosynthesis regulator RemA family protein [Candidatus Omnitrophota bacterium]
MNKGQHQFVSLGFNNMVAVKRIIAVVSADAAPIRRLIKDARKINKLIDATNGRRTRAVIISDSDHIILSSAQPETFAQRIEQK